VLLLFEPRRCSTRLNHPNVASIFDFNTTEDGTDYLVTEYIAGVGLDEQIARAALPNEDRSLNMSLRLKLPSDAVTNLQNSFIRANPWKSVAKSAAENHRGRGEVAATGCPRESQSLGQADQKVAMASSPCKASHRQT